MDFKRINEQGISCFLNLDRFGLSSFALKMIAIITMFIDHFAIFFARNHGTLYIVLRSVGRLSFPIFCFVLVEGFFHTRSKLNHAIRLGVFALISEIPYNTLYGKFFDLSHQNVMFTLLIGFLIIWGLDILTNGNVKYPEKLLKHIGTERLNVILRLVIMFGGLALAYYSKASYQHAGVLLIICFYTFKKQHIGCLVSNLVFNMGMYSFGVQWWGALSAVPIALYNGKPGKKGGKYFFYWFYPVHIIFLLMLKFVQLKFR